MQDFAVADFRSFCSRCCSFQKLLFVDGAGRGANGQGGTFFFGKGLDVSAQALDPAADQGQGDGTGGGVSDRFRLIFRPVREK